MATTYIKELSIQVNLSGLSFCILNRTDNRIEFLDAISFEKKLAPHSVLDELKAYMASNTAFSDTFSAITIIHHNALSTLVPETLFVEANSADYLKFNSKILQTDFVANDTISVNNSINVYVPYVNINNYIFETFGTFVYKHSSTVLIDALLQQEKDNKEKKVVININQFSFEIAVLHQGTLILFNSFDYATKEDFIYFVLFTFEQLQLDPETIALELTGHITEEDENFEILYKYIRHVSLLEKNYTFDFAEHINSKKKSNYFYVLNSF